MKFDYKNINYEENFGTLDNHFVEIEAFFLLTMKSEMNTRLKNVDTIDEIAYKQNAINKIGSNDNEYQLISINTNTQATEIIELLFKLFNQYQFHFIFISCYNIICEPTFYKAQNKLNSPVFNQ